MRPYVPGEDLTGISVSDQDTPELGGMIARNADNHKDQWYIAKDFYEKNYKIAETDSCNCDSAKFVKHIESHLEPGQEVMCKICGKAISEIVNEV